MAKRPPTTTIQWVQKEFKPLLGNVQLVVKSQLGYDGRRFEKTAKRKILQTVVLSEGVVHPFEPSKNIQRPLSIPVDVFERAQVVAAGVRTFATLLSQGVYPGAGGYVLNENGQKIFTKFKVPDLTKVAEQLSKLALSVPSGLPNLTKLGILSTGNVVKVAPTTPNEIAKEAIIVDEKLVPKDETLTKEETEFLLKAAKSVGDTHAEEAIFGKKPSVYRPELPTDFNLEIENKHNLAESKESAVPATRISRLATFGQLAFGLLGGATAEITRRTFQFGEQTATVNPFLSSANADRIVATLCRVRGAALKLGQMLSIQDSNTVPQPLLEIFERVRQSADFMPLKQVDKQMTEAFGEDWRSKFVTFEDRPFAAASIGQVHHATLADGRHVAVKIQYPGVAEGIDSDIKNLVSVLSVGGIFPKGMFLDAFVTVAKRELILECDYEREARAMRKFRELIDDWKDVYVPEVIDELSSKRVLTTEYVQGKPVDACLEEPQVVRDYISTKFIELCLKEIFVWRFMQTDPNWSNFFFGKHPKTGEPRLILLDFGASRAYSKDFVDIYMKIIKAAYEGNEKGIIEHSREIGFLTGYETEIMEKAHVESVSIMGETLASQKPYDFAQQDITTRIQKLIPIMLEHRLTSPPEEIYSLHRKLSGCYLLAAKLKATVSCGGLFAEISENYRFGPDGKDIDIEK